MAAPINIAAIDAGSNAIRLVIARARSPLEIRKLRTVRFAVRLGHHVFTHRRLEEETMVAAVEAFQQFRKLLDRYEVEKVRAVATAAAREARNRRILIDWIYGESGLYLEVIDDAEESRLVRSAVQLSLGETLAPQLIFDLGGGSMELSFLQEGSDEYKVALPIGTVRLMEMFGIEGSIGKKEMLKLQSHLLSLFENSLPQKKNFSNALAVVCGGNAEALAILAPGTSVGGIRTLQLSLLERNLKTLLKMNVQERMHALRLRRDRAEVIGIAAIIFSTLGHYLNLQALLVPGVGVREGILRDLVTEHFSRELQIDEEIERKALASARSFAARYLVDENHAQQVSKLALSLFDQLRTIHGMGLRERLILELAGVLHDVGHFISKKYHHKHGEYFIRNGNIPGVESRMRDMIACLVLYHRKLNPDRDHENYVSFDPERRRQIRLLSSILRIAEGLDCEHRQAVEHILVEIEDHQICLKLKMKGQGQAAAIEGKQSAKFFEKEFGLKTVFRRE